MTPVTVSIASQDVIMVNAIEEQFKVRIFMILIVLSVGLFYLGTVREGHDWGDDFSLYISHARNIVEGVEYGRTGYIYNPFVSQGNPYLVQVGPKTYPPIFPLLLAPVYKLWGMNLKAMKIGVILTFLLSLILIFLTFRNDLSWPHLISLIAIIGFNPYFWRFKDNIVSDLPFLMFVYLALFLIQRAYQVGQADQTGRALNILLISLSIYLAYGTRSIGLVLLPCLVVYDLIRNRRLTAFACIIVALTSVLIALQNVFLHSEGSYAGQLGINPGMVVGQAGIYMSELSAFWAGDIHRAFRISMFLAISGLAFAGYVARIRERITTFELFPGFYLIPLFLLPVPVDVRYLMPVVPLYLFYVFRGLQGVFPRKERVVFLTLMAVFVTIYVLQYAKLDYGPINDGITKSEARQFFDYVKRETNENDVLIFRKPRALALITGRKASIWHHPKDDQELWNYIQQINATYLIVGPRHLDPTGQEYFRGFVARRVDRLEETYENADFQVYRVKGMTQSGISVERH
jgi:hypothetical protein